MPRIPAETAESPIGEAFAAAGCSTAEGARIAASLVSANLAGHDSHGIVRVPGDPERITAAERRANGLPLADDAWNAILAAVRATGMAPERIDALLANGSAGG